MPIPMLVITTTDDSGEPRTRRPARLDSDGRIYVSAHHWPRAWYRRALEIRESLGQKLETAAVLANLGSCHAGLGQLAPAWT